MIAFQKKEVKMSKILVLSLAIYRYSETLNLNVIIIKLIQTCQFWTAEVSLQGFGILRKFTYNNVCHSNIGPAKFPISGLIIKFNGM